MIIAINTRILSGDDAIRHALQRRFETIAASQPVFQFFFISEQQFTFTVPLPNVQYQVLPQKLSGPLWWRIWYDWRLPALLKKIKADVLVTADGIASRRLIARQCLLIGDLDFIDHPQWYARQYIRFASAPGFFKKAAAILVHVPVVKKRLEQQYGLLPEKIITLPPATDPLYRAVSWETREVLKQQYAAGKEYFLFSGAVHPRSSLIDLLKAFSIFKRRQKSGMRLIIASAHPPADAGLLSSLASYKYRDEITVLTSLPLLRLAALTAASYACINLSPRYHDIASLLDAVCCETPVLSGDNAIAKELLGEAALYASPGVPDSVAEKMMLLYKDEAMRAGQIQKGSRLLEALNHASADAQLWEAVVRPTL